MTELAKFTLVDRAIASKNLTLLEQAMELLSDENILRLGSIEKGRILRCIKEEKLYKVDGTFPTYCERRWGYSQRHVRRLIEAAGENHGGQNVRQGDMPKTKSKTRQSAPDPDPEPEEFVAEEPNEEGVWEPTEEVGEPLTEEDEEEFRRENEDGELMVFALKIAGKINAVRHDLEDITQEIRDTDWSPDPSYKGASRKSLRYVVDVLTDLTKTIQELDDELR